MRTGLLFQQTLDLAGVPCQQQGTGVPNKEKDTEHRNPSTDNDEGGIAREAPGETSADDFVAKLIASGVPLITSDEMWEDLGVDECAGGSTARLDTGSTGPALRAGAERLPPS